jgi:acyl dehydratase
VRYWEDIKQGEVFELGSRTMDKERMIAFAREFDPQPFHTDEKAAEASIWGGLIASGWLTGSTLMRLLYDGFLKDTASLGSPGIDELRWLKPVRPGDVLRGRYTVLAAEPHPRRPDRGTVRSLAEVFNQDGVLVMTVRAANLIAKRHPPAASRAI